MTDAPTPTTETVKRARPPVVWPAALLLALTALLAWLDADLIVSGWFYVADPTWGHHHDGWIHAGRAPWSYIDEIAPLAGVALGGIASIMAIVGSLSPRWRRHRFATSFLGLAVVIGPLLIVNATLKTTWGRPRPNVISDFNGPEEYRPVWSPGPNTIEHRSFPSGHASIGFALMLPAFLFYRRRRDLYERWMVGGFLYGVLMSASRIVQGSHFISDVLWSAGLVYLTGALLYRLVDPEYVDPEFVESVETRDVDVPDSLAA